MASGKSPRFYVDRYSIEKTGIGGTSIAECYALHQTHEGIALKPSPIWAIVASSWSRDEIWRRSGDFRSAVGGASTNYWIEKH